MNENIYYSDKNPNSNFEGDWNDVCVYCNRPHSDHIFPGHPDPDYKHRMPCEEQKKFMLVKHNRQVFTLKAIILVGWILVPLAITILGFASPVVGVILLVISIFKIGITTIKHFGSPDKWIPGYTEKMEKERKMKHYYYHCEKNPDAFNRPKIENFRLEEESE